MLKIEIMFMLINLYWIGNYMLYEEVNFNNFLWWIYGGVKWKRLWLLWSYWFLNCYIVG